MMKNNWYYVVGIVVVAVIVAHLLFSKGMDKDVQGVSTPILPSLSVSTSFAKVSVSTFADSLKSANSVLLDVRTTEEYAQDHLDAAINVDFYQQSNFRAKLQELDKSKNYFVYCNSGNRSGQSMAIFKELGFTSVTDLQGGITAWKKAGYSTVK
jgi:rhodanese-related sulfurtransferase